MKTIFRHALGGIALSLFVSASLAQGTSAGGSNAGPFRIGVMTDMTGPFSDISGKGAVNAVQMAVEDFGGQVLGRPIEVVMFDHQNKADMGSTKAREWFDTQNVQMINNLMNSAVALSVVNVAKEKNRIAIVNGAGTSRLSGDACTPNSIHYSYDTDAVTNSTAKAIVAQGGDTWYFVTVDYAFGHSLEADATKALTAAGGRVIGSIRHPLNASDYSSFMLQAKSSKAKVVGLAEGGATFINAVKAAKEFGVGKASNQIIAGLLVYITDVHALGLEQAQGTVLTNAFYWDRDAETRKWSKRFFERVKRMPTMTDAGDYSSTLHYLNAVKATGISDASKVMAQMRATPVNDMFAKNGRIREDGRMVHDMYLYEVKRPSESKYAWDYLKLKQVIPGDRAFRPMSEGACPLVKK